MKTLLTITFVSFLFVACDHDQGCEAPEGIVVNMCGDTGKPLVHSFPMKVVVHSENEELTSATISGMEEWNARLGFEALVLDCEDCPEIDVREFPADSPFTKNTHERIGPDTVAVAGPLIDNLEDCNVTSGRIGIIPAFHEESFEHKIHIMAHEIGHVLGFHHDKGEQNSLMAAGFHGMCSVPDHAHVSDLLERASK